MQSKISLCYHPTTTLIVDDNVDFLLSVSLHLEGKNLLYRQESQPSKALQFLNQVYKANPFTYRCIQTAEDRDLDRVVFDFDFRKIHHEVYNPKRFQEITVIIVDYAMPAMNGLDFCAQVEEDTIKKMMLTSEADQELAIQAFNDGLINKFMKKGIPDLPYALIQNLEELQKKYFLTLSDMTLSKTTSFAQPEPACLRDINFVRFFHELCKAQKIIEYYLLDEHGSFVFLNADAHPSWLVVKSEKDMANLYQYAKDQEAPLHILDMLKKRTHVPYFHTDDDLQVSFDQCEPYLHPATRLEGQQSYYYAYIEHTSSYQLEQDKILSFHQYLNQR